MVVEEEGGVEKVKVEAGFELGTFSSSSALVTTERGEDFVSECGFDDVGAAGVGGGAGMMLALRDVRRGEGVFGW